MAREVRAPARAAGCLAGRERRMLVLDAALRAVDLPGTALGALDFLTAFLGAFRAALPGAAFLETCLATFLEAFLEVLLQVFLEVLPKQSTRFAFAS